MKKVICAFALLALPLAAQAQYAGSKTGIVDQNGQQTGITSNPLVVTSGGALPVAPSTGGTPTSAANPLPVGVQPPTTPPASMAQCAGTGTGTGGGLYLLIPNQEQTICNGTTGLRYMLNITTYNAVGGKNVYCTWDGTTLGVNGTTGLANNWDIIVYPITAAYYSDTNGNLPNGPIICIVGGPGATNTVIKATATQTGATP